jgi:hypothetical protein
VAAACGLIGSVCKTSWLLSLITLPVLGFSITIFFTFFYSYLYKNYMLNKM